MACKTEREKTKRQQGVQVINADIGWGALIRPLGRFHW